MSVSKTIANTFRLESGRVLAALISQFRDFELAEDALQEALLLALEKWPAQGIPRNPGAWLTTIAKRRVIDRLRRQATASNKQPQLMLEWQSRQEPEMDMAMESYPDERLKLIFTCCHPALAQEAQIALTLRTLGGLTTEEIASAFLVPTTTMAQRLVRAKRKIRQAGIPFRVPPAELLDERISAVLAVVYLIFNEGYAASSGPSLIRRELIDEAIRLACLIVRLTNDGNLPVAVPEAEGLLALMLLHDARTEARTDENGEIILLPQQDRSLWDKTKIEKGLCLVERALKRGRPGQYQIQAAISAVHAEAATAAETDWLQIAALYGELLRLGPSPIVRLNQAVAVAEADGPLAGLMLLDRLVEESDLKNYFLYHAARADLLRRADMTAAAISCYERAIALAPNDVNRRFLTTQLAQLRPPSPDL